MVIFSSEDDKMRRSDNYRWFSAVGAVLLLVLGAWALSCGGEIVANQDDSSERVCREGEVLAGSICENNEWQEGYEGPCQGVNCGGRGACFDEGGAARCECDPGYEADGLTCVASDPNSGNGGDACEGVDCSGHGSCFVGVGGQAQCNCDSGYDAVGTSCVPPHPCEGITCGEHGSCKVEGDDPVCDCEDGFSAEAGDLSCLPDDEPHPCEGQDCSGHGNCVADIEGNASCNCDEDYSADGLSCFYDPPPADPCEGVTCSGQGTCFDSGGQAACNCNSGYQAQGTNCVPEDDPDPCDGVNCGANSSCEEQGATGVCVCDDGYHVPAGSSECVAIPVCTNVQGDCAVHVLHPGATSYAVIDYEDTDLAEVLDSPIGAAFGIEGTDRGYLFTETHYYQIDTSNFSVIKSGELGDFYALLGDVGPALAAGVSVPARFHGYSTGDDLVLLVRPGGSDGYGDVVQFRYDYANEAVGDELTDGWLTDFDWSQTVNPDFAPSITNSYRGAWADDQNARGFLTNAPGINCFEGNGCCDKPEQGWESIMTGLVTNQGVNYEIPGACTDGSDFVEFQSTSSSPIFGFGNAPVNADIGGVIWHNETFYIFTKGYFE